MKTLSLKTAGPFLLLTFIYFIVGFLTTVNGQCQGPLKVAFLSDATTMRNSLTTLVSFAFFLGYLLNSSRTGRMLNQIGYKRTLMRSLIVMVGGLLFYTASAFCAEYVPCEGVAIHGDFVPFGYFVFLVGSFLMGTAAAMLQVVINPYIAAYPLPGTSAVQRMNFTCAVNSFGTTIAPLFVTGIMFAGVPLDNVQASQLTLPFILMTLCIVVTTMTTRRLALPDIEGTRSASTDTTASDGNTRSVWSFRNLKYGVITIFFYVGTEVSIGNNINLHAMELSDGGLNVSPALLATIYWAYGVGFDEEREAAPYAHHRCARRYSAHDSRYAHRESVALVSRRLVPLRNVELRVHACRRRTRRVHLARFGRVHDGCVRWCGVPRAAGHDGRLDRCMAVHMDHIALLRVRALVVRT